MPLDVSSQAEDCERKVQNIWYDNGDVYLGTATKESFFLCCWPCILVIFDFMFQLNAPFVCYIYQLPLHVPSNIVLIIRRIHCIHTASGSLFFLQFCYLKLFTHYLHLYLLHDPSLSAFWFHQINNISCSTHIMRLSTTQHTLNCTEICTRTSLLKQHLL